MMGSPPGPGATANDILGLAHALSEAGEPFALATVVRCERPTSAKPGAKALVRQDGTVVGWIGGSCAEPVVVREGLRALQDRRPRLIALIGEGGSSPERRAGVIAHPMTCHSGGTVEIFVEPVLPKPELILVGRGPVADALASLGSAAGLTVTSVSPESPADGSLQLRVPPRSFVVVVTHGGFDEEPLEHALQSDASYVSLVASVRRAAAVIDVLRARGVSEDRLRRLKAPAGLDIGAVTPGEIAVSILAEIIQVSRSQAAESRPAQAMLATDPVCGMSVQIASAGYRSEASDRSFYFCGARCKRTFDQNPTRYVAGGAK
jgi:xanthine dehydrogenase accessory factor